MGLRNLLRGAADLFLGGRGEYSITVPVMDGPLRPNNYLERCESMGLVVEADNVVANGDKLLLSSGDSLLEKRPDGQIAVLREFGYPISCLAVSPTGAIAVGLDGKGIEIVNGPHNAVAIDKIGKVGLTCPTAALFLDEENLIVANGSKYFSSSQWSHDLLHHGRSGAVARIELDTKKTSVLASGMRFPCGLGINGSGEIVISEAWAHRLVAIAPSGKGSARIILSDLPAYPGRICASRQGGYWLAMFATRSQLLEFVLRERRYRRRMIAEIKPEFWIAPTLSSGKSFKEPLQAGGVIRLGIHKPWAPTRSYGLVVRLDGEFQPVWSAHSRADGKRHGITSVAEVLGRLVVTSKGKGEIIAIPHTELSEPDDLSTAELYA